MKNKKFKIVIVFLIAMMIGSNKALAFTETRIGLNGRVITINDDLSITSGVTKEYVNGISEKMSTHNFAVKWKDESGNEHNELGYFYWRYSGSARDLHCLDPGNISDTEIYARRFLLSDYNSFEVNVYDTAVMSVLTSNASYHAKNVAIRTLSVLWGFQQDKEWLPVSDSNGSYHLYSTYFGQALEWVTNNAKINEYYNALRAIPQTRIQSTDTFKGTMQYTPAGYSSNQTYILENHTFYDTNGGNTVATATTLFENALKDALDYAKSHTNGSIKVEENKNIAPTKTPTVVTSDTELITYEKTYEFNLSDFTNDSKAIFSVDSVRFDKGYSAVGAKLEPYITNIKVNDTVVYDRMANVGSYSYGENILSKVSGLDYKNIKISVTIKIEANYNVGSGVQHISCATQPMNYTLKYHYDDSSLSDKFSNYVGIIWRGRKVVQGKDGKLIASQRFVSVEETNNKAESKAVAKEIKEGITLIDCASCDVLVKSCKDSGNINSTSCRELEAKNCGCEGYATLCSLNSSSNACNLLETDPACKASCDTTVSSNFQCCDIDNNILLISQYNKKEISINGPEDIVSCFVKQVDAEKSLGKDGSTYDEAGNNYAMYSNKYCTISCKEDYLMSMPSSKKVNASGYFTFNVGINGNKTCYSNTIDKNNEFESDLEDAQNAVMEAYRHYIKWVAVRNAANSATIYTTHTGSTTYRYSYTETVVTGKDCPTVSSCMSACKGIGSIGAYNQCINVCLDRPCKDITGEVTNWATGTCSNSANPATGNAYTFYYGGVNYYFGVSSITGPSHANYDGAYCSWTRNYYTQSAINYTHSLNRSNYGKSGNVYTVKSASDYDAIVADALSVLRKAYNNLTKIVSDYNACTNFAMNYNYDAKLTYSYAEYLSREGEMSSNVYTGNTKEWFCKSSLTNGYKSGSCSGYGNESTTNPTTTKNIYKCTFGSTVSCAKESQIISTAKYVSKSISVNASYEPINNRYNHFPSGAMDNNSTNGVYAGNRLSVNLNSGKEIKEYNIYITNLGEFYSASDRSIKGTNGRLAGNRTYAVLKDNNFTNYSNNRITYNCSYLVNMGNVKEGDIECLFDNCGGPCRFDCIGSGCDSYCSGGSCNFNCLGSGCIYSKDDGLYVYEKEVSLNNLFPEGADSYNWNKNVNEKARETIKEIEDNGEKVFSGTPILKFTMDGSSANKIKEYNKQNPSYSNDTMYFRSIGSYQNIAGFSSFIDDVITGKYNLEVDSESEVITKRNPSNPTSNNYFRSWAGYSSYESYINNNPDIQRMLGPSWK